MDKVMTMKLKDKVIQGKVYKKPQICVGVCVVTGAGKRREENKRIMRMIMAMKVKDEVYK